MNKETNKLIATGLFLAAGVSILSLGFFWTGIIVMIVGLSVLYDINVI